jgi:predicted DNA-binding transcriptional regulator AlpA
MKNEGKTPDSMIVTLTVGELREIVRQELRGELGGRYHSEDRLVDINEAAKMLSAKKDWLYHNRKRLPFVKKTGPKSLRFSVRGIQAWIAGKQNG